MMVLFCIVCHSAGTLAIGTDSTLCDTGMKITQEVKVIDNMNVLSVSTAERQIIIAIDTNQDGWYTVLIFDTNGNGYADMQLEGGYANAEEVIWLYCEYQRLEMTRN